MKLVVDSSRPLAVQVEWLGWVAQQSTAGATGRVAWLGCSGPRSEAGSAAPAHVNIRTISSGGSRIFARGVRQLVPLECPKPLYALSPSDP